MPDVETVPHVAYFIQELRRLDLERLAILEEFVNTSPDEVKEVIAKPDDASKLRIALLRLDIESACDDPQLA
jgi:hypothetical protein